MSPSCAFVHVASQLFLPGLLTLLDSLRRHARATLPCKEHVFLWHRWLNDTKLSRATMRKVACAAPGNVTMHQVADDRARLWLSAPVLRENGHSAYWKLEVFFLDRSPGIWWIVLDADMLVLRPPPPGWSLVQRPPHGDRPEIHVRGITTRGHMNPRPWS